MRNVDERCAAVRGRTRRLRRKREGGVAAVVAALALFSLVDLVGRSASGGIASATPAGESLFGAASLFGPSVGGYVLVALVAAVIAVLITALCITRHRSGKEDADVPEAPTAFPDEIDSQER